MSILLIISCSRCKEKCTDATNPDCPNYVPLVVVDPCAGALTTSADFIMYQSLTPGLASDTLIQFYHYCFTNKTITLKASQDSANYHWIIGADDYFTQEVTFEIGSQFENADIPLKLVVTRNPDVDCYPNDNGVDTVTKTIVARHFCAGSMAGRYCGTWENEAVDSFVVELIFEPDGVSQCGRFNLSGVQPTLPDTCINGSFQRLDNYLRFDGFSGACFMPIGKAKLDSTLQNIFIDYSLLLYTNQNEPRVYHLFNGHRIN